MEVIKNQQEIFKILSLDKTFFKVYLEDYFKRLLVNERDLNLVLKAFNNFHKSKIIEIEDLINLGDNLNFNFKTFGFRTFDYPAEEKSYAACSSHFIYRKVRLLLNCYHGFWSEIDSYEKETFFHLQLIKITPYAINNELICKIILMSSLMKNYIPPFILKEEDYLIYNECLKTSDALKLKGLFKKRSKEEFDKMVKLYKEYYNLPLTKDIREIILLKV